MNERSRRERHLLRFRRRYGSPGPAYGPVLHMPLTGYDFFIGQLYKGPSMPGAPAGTWNTEPPPVLPELFPGLNPFDVLSRIMLGPEPKFRPMWFNRQLQPIDSRAANALLADADGRRVAFTTITSATDPVVRFEVSTVFLVLDHAGPFDALPLLFETMVFGGTADQDTTMWRWTTEAEARAGHESVVASVAATVPDDVVEHQAVNVDAETP